MVLFLTAVVALIFWRFFFSLNITILFQGISLFIVLVIVWFSTPVGHLQSLALHQKYISSGQTH